MSPLGPATEVRIALPDDTDRERCAGHYVTVAGRVLGAELTARFGRPIRVGFDPDGPAAIDELVGAGPLFPAALYRASIPDRVADVRARMLEHLGLLPIDLLDAEAIDRFAGLELSATDWCLIVTRAKNVDTAGAAGADLAAFRDDPAPLAGALDRLADRLRPVIDEEPGDG